MNIRQGLIMCLFCVLPIMLYAQSNMGGIGSSMSSAMGGNTQNAEEKPLKQRPQNPEDSIAWHGQFLGLNLVPAVQAAFSSNWGVQIQYHCNLHNRFFPAIEFGYARQQSTRELSDWQAKQFSNTLTTLYRGYGFYAKIGLDLPIAKTGPDANNLFFVGLRYAGATCRYDLLTVPFLNNYWTNAYVMNTMDQHSLAHWLELVAGLRVEITPSITLGWTFTYKHLLGRSKGESSVAPCIPGYGQAENWWPTLGAWFYWRLPW